MIDDAIQRLLDTTRNAWRPALRGALLFGLGSRLLAQAIIDPLARQPRYAVQRRAHVSLPSK
ncbi:hypothetical protein D0837_17810, partial [Bordetella avium]|uniref:hypothetical protein n=1 Tax=Bordetella avium TaxID=521 RepID=UPI000FF4EF92